MRIFIALNSRIKEIEVTPSTFIEDVKALVEVEVRPNLHNSYNNPILTLF